MKKLLALVLALALVISMLPANVVAMDPGEIVDFTILDTYVYDFMRLEDGKFDGYSTKVAITYADESTAQEEVFFYSNTVSYCFLGEVVCTDSQNEALWEVGNTYQVQYGDGKSFNVEVRQSPISRIEIEDCTLCGYYEDAGSRYYYYNPVYTVYYQEGSSEEYYDEFTYEYLDGIYWTTLKFADSQFEEPWVLGETYEVTGTLLGISDTFNVTVVAVEDIQVEDVVRFEGDTYPDGNLDENDNWVDNTWQVYDTWPEYITVIFTDHSSVSGTPGEIDELYNCFGVSCSSEQAYDNQWGVGEHTATVEYAGVRKDYTVIVKEPPIESIEIEDVEIMQGTNGYWEGDRFYYKINSLNAKVTLTDGVQEITDSIEIDGNAYDINYDLWELQQEQPWGVGTYEVTGTLLGVSDTFTVTITESPIKSIEIADVEIIEYSNGSYENGNFYYYTPALTATVTFADNSTEVINGEIQIGKEWYGIDTDMWSRQAEQPWTAIGTYEVTGSIMGVSDTFTVTITEGPVESIEIQDITIMEYTEGYFNDDFYYYEPVVKATITLKDGTVITESYLEIGDGYYGIELDTSSQREEHWTAGNTYTATGSLMGVSDTFQITITEAPVESLEIEDVILIEGDGEYTPGGNCNYHIYMVDGKVTLKDGTVISVEEDREVEIDGEWYYIEINSDSQYDTPWTVGNTYTATANLLGVTDTFNVTIQPTPVESIAFADVVLIEGIDSRFNGEHEEYGFSPVLTEVLLKDGTRPEIYDNGILYGDQYYWTSHNAWDVQYEEPWTPGNTYQITGWLLGVETTVNVTILEDPIRDLELVKAPDQRESMVGAYPNLKGATVRIHYTDNTYEDVIISDDYTVGYSRTFFSKKLNRRTTIEAPERFERAGQQMAEVELFGHTCKIPYTVKENKMHKLILTENADKSITVSVLNYDNTGFDMKILDMCFVFMADNNAYFTDIFTEIGLFEAVVYTHDNTFKLELRIGEESSVISNTIAASEWFEMMLYMQNHPVYNLAYAEASLKNYTGTITADNVDAVIEVAGMLDNLFYTGEIFKDAEGNYYEIISGEKIRSAVKKYFTVENVDLSLSAYYDSRKDIVKCYGHWTGMDESRTSGPKQISYKNGVWSVSASVETYDGTLQILQMNLDSQLRIKNYSLGDGSAFTDIKTTSWQYSAAKYALDNNLMAGKGTDSYGRVKFDPNSSITREEFVQVLYNAENKPTVTIENCFPDVKDKGWYKNAVLWANESGIASGLGDGSFGIGRNITRQDLAVMLYKYAKLKNYDLTATPGKIDQFADGSKVSGYAKEAMNWAVTNGVLSGKGTAGKPLNTFRLDPAGTATRAECAAMLKNFMEAFNS